MYEIISENKSIFFACTPCAFPCLHNYLIFTWFCLFVGSLVYSALVEMVAEDFSEEALKVGVRVESMGGRGASPLDTHAAAGACNLPPAHPYIIATFVVPLSPILSSTPYPLTHSLTHLATAQSHASSLHDPRRPRRPSFDTRSCLAAPPHSPTYLKPLSLSSRYPSHNATTVNSFNCSLEASASKMSHNPPIRHKYARP